MTREEAKNITLAISSKYGDEQRVTVDDVCELIDQIYDEFEARGMFLTKEIYCDECKYYLSDNGNYPLEPCGECSRFYADRFEREGDEN